MKYTILALALLLSACATTNTKLNKLNDKHPIDVANWVTKQFPVKTDSTRTILYLPGKEIPGPTKFVAVNCDSFENEYNKLKQYATDHYKDVDQRNKWLANQLNSSAIQIQCPPDYHRIDTIRDMTRIVEELTSKTTALSLERDKATADATAFKSERNEARKWLSYSIYGNIALAILLLLLLYIWFVKPKR